MFNRIFKVSLSLFVLPITCLAMEVEKQPNKLKLHAPVPRKPGQKYPAFNRSKTPAPGQPDFEETDIKTHKPFSNLSSIQEKEPKD